MSSKLCPFCMRMAEGDTCPHCGKSINYAGSPAHLPAGYVVSGKHPYVLGAALGQGGFGITYIALDMVTNERVAIKEYYPTYCSTRTNDSTVTAYSNQEEVYRKGKERFLDEARTLKSLSDLKSIVNVLDFFEANNSAYLVMEFLEGSSLKDYAAKNGKFPAQKFLSQIQPLMEDIHRMHERGVIHRDIAPDNIILLPDGQMKLIDFGAARSYLGDKSMTVVVKKGFAPVEQYFSTGSTTSSDVYALAATIYYCITGIVPMDSAQRQNDGTPLASPAALGADITPLQEKALAKALEIQQKARTQSVQEFLDDLNKEPDKPKPEPVKPKPPVTNPDSKEQKPLPRKKKPVWIAAAAAILVVVVFVGVFVKIENKTISTYSSVTESAYAHDAWKSNIMMQTDMSSRYVVGSEIPRIQVASVTFLDTNKDAPDTSWDISQAKNGSVLAWVEKRGNRYDLYIGANGGINGQFACTGMFYSYSNLLNVNFNGCFYTDYVADLSHMFEGCSNLTALDISYFNTPNVLNMSAMFKDCENMTTLDISGFDTGNVTNMSSMFEACEKLETLDVSNFDTFNVENMVSMFKGCSELDEINIDGWYFYGVNEYHDFMDEGKKIKGQPWEELFTKSTVKHADAWRNNVLKKSPDSKFEDVVKDEICSVTFLDTVIEAPKTAWDVSEVQNGSVLAWTEKNRVYYDLYIAGEGGINAVNACGELFARYSNLKEINFNNCFHTEMVADMSGMFRACNSLTTLDVGGWDVSNVTNMSGMFESCNNLTTLDVSGWDVSDVTNMSRMFYECKELITLNVSGWNVSNVTNMARTFCECRELTTLDVSGWDVSDVTSMFAMFESCNKLTKLDVSGWDTSKVENYNNFMNPGKKVNGRPLEELFEK